MKRDRETDREREKRASEREGEKNIDLQTLIWIIAEIKMYGEEVAILSCFG